MFAVKANVSYAQRVSGQPSSTESSAGTNESPSQLEGFIFNKDGKHHRFESSAVLVNELVKPPAPKIELPMSAKPKNNFGVQSSTVVVNELVKTPDLAFYPLMIAPFRTIRRTGKRNNNDRQKIKAGSKHAAKLEINEVLPTAEDVLEHDVVGRTRKFGAYKACQFTTNPFFNGKNESDKFGAYKACRLREEQELLTSYTSNPFFNGKNESDTTRHEAIEMKELRRQRKRSRHQNLSLSENEDFLDNVAEQQQHSIQLSTNRRRSTRKCSSNVNLWKIGKFCLVTLLLLLLCPMLLSYFNKQQSQQAVDQPPQLPPFASLSRRMRELDSIQISTDCKQHILRSTAIFHQTSQLAHKLRTGPIDAVLGSNFAKHIQESTECEKDAGRLTSNRLTSYFSSICTELNDVVKLDATVEHVAKVGKKLRCQRAQPNMNQIVDLLKSEGKLSTLNEDTLSKAFDENGYTAESWPITRSIKPCLTSKLSGTTVVQKTVTTSRMMSSYLSNLFNNQRSVKCSNAQYVLNGFAVAQIYDSINIQYYNEPPAKRIRLANYEDDIEKSPVRAAVKLSLASMEVDYKRKPTSELVDESFKMIDQLMLEADQSTSTTSTTTTSTTSTTTTSTTSTSTTVQPNLQVNDNIIENEGEAADYENENEEHAVFHSV